MTRTFQSTLPVREATIMTSKTPVRVAISIRASRVGSDRYYNYNRRKTKNFNPRFPCGKRLLSNISLYLPYVFQSTLPVWEATAGRQRRQGRPWNFNPRFPCGKRPFKAHDNGIRLSFQSTLPVWEATRCWPSPFVQRTDFNPRFPCGKRLQTGALKKSGITDFNPRFPCGKRHAAQDMGAVPPVISIHASRVGSDLSSLRYDAVQ